MKPIDPGDLEQLQQEDALYPWLADNSMADETEAILFDADPMFEDDQGEDL